MRFIRTKDNFIYRITTRDFGIFVIDEKGNLIGRIDADEIIKQADTIEELCDEFVFIDVGVFRTNRYIYKSLREAESKDFLYDKCYGAIWTDKGLIYVAKMNDKGGLELL